MPPNRTIPSNEEPVKAMLRKLKARTYKDLIKGIESAMLQVTQKDIRNWFTHCCYCTS